MRIIAAGAAQSNSCVRDQSARDDHSVAGDRSPTTSAAGQQCRSHSFDLSLYSGDDEAKLISVSGRAAWVLLQLISAGRTGVVPSALTGHRWSDSIYKLRRLGIAIDTVLEAHGGDFRGRHARYRLAQPISLVNTHAGTVKPIEPSDA